MNAWMDGGVNGWISEWMDAQGWMDALMNGFMNS